MMQQSLNESNEQNNVQQSGQMQSNQAIFHKYSRSNQNQNIFLNKNIQSTVSQMIVEQAEVNQVGQNHVVDINIQALSEEDQNASLIQYVDKDDQFNQSEDLINNGVEFVGIRESDSKIIHRPIIQHQMNLPLQQQTLDSYGDSINQQKVFYNGSQLSNTTPYQDNNLIRHTIDTSQASNLRQNYQMIPASQQSQPQQLRESLPASIIPHNFLNQQMNGYSNVLQQQPSFQQQQPQVNRLPQHLPQSLISANRSQQQFKPVDFIQQGQQGQQRLQTSEIIYKDRNPNMIGNQPMSMNMHQSNYQAQHQNLEHQQGQTNQAHRGQSLQGSNVNRSIKKKSTNIIFNYNSSQGNSMVQPHSSSVSSSQVQGHKYFVTLPQVTTQSQSRTGSLSPVPQQLAQLPVVVQQLTQPPVVNRQPVLIQQPQVVYKPQKAQPVIVQQQPPIVQPATVQMSVNQLPQLTQPQPIKPETTQSQLVQLQLQSQPKPSTIQVQPQHQKSKWKQRYFSLYSKFSQVNHKVQFISQQVHIYQKLISSTKLQKLAQRHDHFRRVIEQLQQQCVSIKDEWRPQGDFHRAEIKDKGELKKQKAMQALKSSKEINHIQMKYKRLLFNFSKVQQQNTVVKKTLQQKINQVVRRLQDENQSLRDKLQMISNSVSIQRSIIHKKGQQELRQSFNSEDLNPQNEHKVVENIRQWVDDVADIIQAVQQVDERLGIRYDAIEQQILARDNWIARLRAELQVHSQNAVKIQQSVHTEAPHHGLAQSDELTFSASQRIELEQSVAKSHQKNIFLQGQVQRLTQKNKQLTLALTQKDNQLRSGQNAQNATMQNVQGIIAQLNIKLKQYQTKLGQIQDQNIKINERNQDLEHQLNQVSAKQEKSASIVQKKIDNRDYMKQIQQKSRQVSQLQIQNSSLLQNNKALREQVQRVTTKVGMLQIQLLEVQTEHLTSQVAMQQRHLTPQVSAQQQQTPLLIQQYEFTTSSLRNQIIRKQAQLERQSKLSDQRILDLTQQLKLSYKQRENLHKRFQEKTILLEGERQKKEILIRQLRDKMYELQQKRRLQVADEDRKKQYARKTALHNQTQELDRLKSQVQTLKAQKQRVAKDYQLQVKRLQDEVQQLKQDNLRLKKQIGDFANTQNQLQTLAQILGHRNLQITQLKDALFQSQKLAIQNNNFKRQIQRQSQQNTRLTAQSQKLNITNMQVTRSLKDVEQSLNSLKNKFNSLQGQYNLSLEANDRKDHEIVKLRQANQLLETNNDESQKQNSTFKLEIRNMQVTYQHQTTLLKEIVQNLKNKMSDYDKLIRQKSVAEHTIAELQALNQKYQYQLKQNDELLTKQKTKVKTLESQNEDLAQQIETFNQKTKDQEKKTIQSVKKYKKLIEDLQQKNKSLKQKQLKFQKQRIVELEHDLKSKQNKIWKLQKQVEELLQRLDEIGDQEIDGQKIAVLEHKIKEYESRLFNQTFKYGPTNYDYQATKVFERQVIYELKEQNQRLRQFISQKKTMSIKPTTDKNQAGKSQVQIKQAYDEQLDYVQGRLLTFNTKLQSLINNGTYENVQAQKVAKKNRKSPSKQQITKTDNYQSMNNILNITSQNSNAVYELRQLKLKYSQLQRYCKNIQVQLLTGNNQKPFNSAHTINISTTTHHNLQTDQITFHKEKNRQLQERVDKLLKMNTQLKQNLEELLKQRNQVHSVGYYREQILELNQKINVSEIRVKKLIQQNERFKKEFEKDNKERQNSQGRLFDAETKVLQMQRTINQLNQAKIYLQKQVQQIKTSLQSKQYQVKQLKNQLTMTGQKQSSSINFHRQKIQNYETQISKLSNKLRINESQIQRLNQAIKKKQSESAQETNRWRSKVSQLQEEIGRSASQIDNEKSIHSSLKMQMSRLGQQIKSSQYQNQEVKDSNENLIRKLQQSQLKYRQLSAQYFDLQNGFMAKKAEQSQWLMKSEQYEAQNVRLTNQVQFLRQQIQRLNEQTKNRQRNNDMQLQNYQGKLSMAQRQQLDFKRNNSAWGSQRQKLQGQIAILKSKVAMYGAEIERRENQYSAKQRVYEQKISLLKTQIIQIQSNIMSHQQSSSTWTISRQRFEFQIVQMKNQISVLRAQIDRLNQIGREKELFYHKNSNTWNEQKQKYERQITKLSNQVGIQKQEIQRLKFIATEKDTVLSSFRNGSQKLIVDKQNSEQLITRLSNKTAILRQQNDRLNSKISDLQHNHSTSSSDLSIELANLRRQKSQLQLELSALNKKWGLQLEQYRQKIIQMKQHSASFEYHVEFIRSLYLEIQSLIDEIQFAKQKQKVEINQRIAEQLQNGLKNIIQLTQLLAYFK